MRFMMLLKADKTTETGKLPIRKDLEVIGRYNEQLVKAGVLLDAAGLQPSSKGAKVTLDDPDEIEGRSHRMGEARAVRHATEQRAARAGN
ncbi:MAG TPA: hypothetical protein VF332_08365 [Vicinamibacterales bacterium]